MRVVFVATVVIPWFLVSGAIMAIEPTVLSGKWAGTWESQTSGHRGPLSGTFQQTDANHYHVVFHGRFFKVLPFRYSADLDVVGYQDGKVLLAGSRKLLLFGEFHYNAEATSEEFTATYHTRKDRGVFILKRQ